MTGLTHTITQTHRHYRDAANIITIDEAREHKFPLVAECGEVWIPGREHETHGLPMCPQCRAREARFDEPNRPSFVYRCFDSADRLIYVGCTSAPLQRMDQHRLSTWWHPQVSRTRFVVFPTRTYALSKEREAIANENPRWNIRGRDRTLWSLDDYGDCYVSMRMNGSEKKADNLSAQARRRFGVDLEERWVS